MGWSISPDSSWQRQITHLALFLPVCMLELHLRVTGPAAREDILIPVLLEELVQNSQSPTTRTYLPFSWMCITSRPLLPTVPHPPSCCCYCSYSNDHARKKKSFLSIQIPLSRPQEDYSGQRGKAFSSVFLLPLSPTWAPKCLGSSKPVVRGSWNP